jgi:hypothetical protein
MYSVRHNCIILSCYTAIASSWGLHLIVVRRFEYADDPKSYTSGSVAIGRASHVGKVEG